MKHFSVKKLSQLSGVSVRTLHHYDKIGLLIPSIRTEARYRLYGEKELLRLQQILFYKELDFPLNEIRDILDEPEFDLIEALESHKFALNTKRKRIDVMLSTIDKTINQINKGGYMKSYKELYDGLNHETAKNYHDEAINKFGKDVVEKSERELMSNGKLAFENLKIEFQECANKLFLMKGDIPSSNVVQSEIANHYRLIRRLWGTSNKSDNQAEAYAGLGQTYVSDNRYTMMEGKEQPEFALFLKNAIEYFVINNLK